MNWTVQADPNDPKKALVPPAVQPVNGVMPGSNISFGNECSSGVECKKMCFRGRCIPKRKQIVCPAYAQCPPTYWRMYWYLEKLCHNMFTGKHWKYLADGLYKGESTRKDMVYLWNLPGAQSRYLFKSAKYMNSFFYHPRRAEWLPKPCLDVVGKMASRRDVSKSTRSYAKKIRNLWKESKHW